MDGVDKQIETDKTCAARSIWYNDAAGYNDAAERNQNAYSINYKIVLHLSTCKFFILLTVLSSANLRGISHQALRMRLLIHEEVYLYISS